MFQTEIFLPVGHVCLWSVYCTCLCLYRKVWQIICLEVLSDSDCWKLNMIHTLTSTYRKPAQPPQAVQTGSLHTGLHPKKLFFDRLVTWTQTPSPRDTWCLGVLDNRLTHVYYIALFIHHELQSAAECPLLLFAGYSLLLQLRSCGLHSQLACKAVSFHLPCGLKQPIHVARPPRT